MKPKLFLYLFFCAAIFSLAACGKTKSAGPTTSGYKDAVGKAESMGSIAEKEEFLLNEAKAFIEAENYPEAAQIAEYVMDHVNAGSANAQRIARRAYEKMVGTLVEDQ